MGFTRVCQTSQPPNLLLLLRVWQWCGHCKRLEPEWKKANELLSKSQYDITLAIVDATDENNKKLAEEHGVKGFPTIKIYRRALPSVRRTTCMHTNVFALVAASS